MFPLTKPEMVEVYSRYSAKAPEPLSAQFNDCIDKWSAVKAYTEKCGKMRTIRLFQQVSFCHFSRVALYLYLQGITAHTQTYHRRPYFLHLVHSEVIGGRGLLGEQCCHNLGISHIVIIYQPLCFKGSLYVLEMF